MEKPVNLTSKNKKKTPERKNFKKRICIFSQKFTLGKFSVLAWSNQLPGFSVRGTSTPNGLFQTINGLKILMGHTKRLQTKTWCIVPFKNQKSWAFC